MFRASSRKYRNKLDYKNWCSNIIYCRLWIIINSKRLYSSRNNFNNIRIAWMDKSISYSSSRISSSRWWCVGQGMRIWRIMRMRKKRKRRKKKRMMNCIVIIIITTTIIITIIITIIKRKMKKNMKMKRNMMKTMKMMRI